MDTAGFDFGADLNELEEPLSGLMPVTGGLSRERMLFQAGRASAQAESRGPFLIFVAAALVVVVGLGMLSFAERSRRHALEVVIAGLEQRQSLREGKPSGEPQFDRGLGRSLARPPVSSSSFVPPVSIISNDASPYSYRALSLLENPGVEQERRPRAAAVQSARPSTAAAAEQAPLRVRDTGKLLEF
jgi:hypothetical protein